MVQIQELEDYKKQLHSEIDRLFDTTNQDRKDFTMEEFKLRSTKFLKSYYENTVKASEGIFTQDPTIPDFIKVRHKVMQGNTIGEQLLDQGVLKILEVANHLTHSGSNDFRDFNKSAAQALTFIFRIYMRTLSNKLPRIMTHFDENEIASNPDFLQLRSVLDSFGYELVMCFERAKIEHQWKLPLTMIFVSELQESAVKDVSKRLAVEKLAFSIISKVLPKADSEVNTMSIMNAISEAKKEMTDDGMKKREEETFFYLLKVTTDLYITNLQSFLANNILRDLKFSEDTKTKIADIKTNLLAEADQHFNRIK